MIFAELQYTEHYQGLHDDLEVFLRTHFRLVESGMQTDSWFWILDGGKKVAVDTFTSMKHQVKSASPGPHVDSVLRVLRSKYDLRVYDSPELEGHEDV